MQKVYYKEDIKIGDEVITEQYYDGKKLIKFYGIVEKIYNNYCLVKSLKGYYTCINFGTKYQEEEEKKYLEYLKEMVGI